MLLQVHDRLRCVAATGSWQVFSTVPPKAGIVGRVYASGRPAVVPDIADDPDYLPIRPDVTAEVCVPILDPAGRPIGVLDLQWCEPADLDAWRNVAGRLAARLAPRSIALRGPPAESRSEKLLRHAAALTSAGTEWDLMTAAIAAARDVSTLAAAVLILADRTEPRLGGPTATPGELESRIRADGRGGPAALGRRSVGPPARRGDPRRGRSPPDRGPRARPRRRTDLVAVPRPNDGGAVLVADSNCCARPTTVNLIELLAPPGSEFWSLPSTWRDYGKKASRPLTGCGTPPVRPTHRCEPPAGRHARHRVDDFKTVRTDVTGR